MSVVTALTFQALPVIPGGAKRREGNLDLRRAASAGFLDSLPAAFGRAGNDSPGLSPKAKRGGRWHSSRSTGRGTCARCLDTEPTSR